MTYRTKGEDVFTSSNGDLALSPRGQACLDVSLFTNNDNEYTYRMVPSEKQDSKGDILVFSSTIYSLNCFWTTPTAFHAILDPILEERMRFSFC